MKLTDYLKSLVGTELNQEHINIINGDIDTIKEKAVGTVKEELRELKASTKETTEKLATFETAEKDKGLMEQFKKEGGNPDKFELFKKNTIESEDGSIDFEKTFNQIPSMKVDTSQVDISQRQNVEEFKGTESTMDDLIT